MDKPTRHIAGLYKDLVQQCTRCLKIIADDRNVHFQEGQFPPQGFAEGEVNNLGFGWYIGHDPEAVDCEPVDVLEVYEHDEEQP